jgi:hypothetical protein
MLIDGKIVRTTHELAQVLLSLQDAELLQGNSGEESAVVIGSVCVIVKDLAEV